MTETRGWCFLSSAEIKMMKKYLFCLVLVLSLPGFVLPGCGCVPGEETGPEKSFSQESSDSSSSQEREQNKFSRFGYYQLSGVEQIWYRDIEQILVQMQEKGSLSEEGLKAGLDESCIDFIFQRVLDDHPELFYVDGYTYTNYTRDIRTVAIEFSGSYNLGTEEVTQYRAQIDAAVAGLLEGVDETWDDYEKVKYAYETLILHTEYDLNAPRNQDIYSVFVGHASVCQGYAKAFQYLCNRMGVECGLVQGRVKNTGEYHAWNLVKADGAYYYVDTTWGDISFKEEEQEILLKISYDYLCVTGKILEKTHEADSRLVLPECSAVADNYYVREDACFTEYDTEKLQKMVDDAILSGRNLVTFQCTDKACYDQMHQALIEEKGFFYFLEKQGPKSFVYMDNESQLTITFFMMTSN